MAGSFAPEFDSPRRFATPSGELAITFAEPVRALDVTSVRNAVANQSIYEAGAHTRRTATWNAPTTSANSGVLSNLTTLRDRSRAATRNNGYAKGVLQKLVSNMIGIGLKPLSRVQDRDLRKAIHALWDRWVDVSSTDGILGWYGQQAQITHTWLQSGECFARLRERDASDNLPVSLQVQVIEPDFCPHNHTRFNGANRIRAGIEFNAIGQRVRYWIYRERPGDPQEIDTSQLTGLAAERIIHIYDQERAGQLRGIPHLTAALPDLNELDKFTDATLLRQQIQNLFAGFVKRTPSTVTPTVDPLTGLEPDTTDDDKPMVSLEAGIMQELDQDEDVTWSDPPDASTNYGDFIRQVLIKVSAATRVPYEVLTGDLSKLNDRTVRVVLSQFRREIQFLQHEIIGQQLCRRVWYAWLDRAVLVDRALPINPDRYRENREEFAAVTWTPHKWDYINPVQDIQSQKEAMRNGLTSRSAIVSANGDDAEVIDEEQADDNARADKLGIKYDSDGRNASGGPTTEIATTDDQPDPDAAPPSPSNAIPPVASSLAPTMRLELATAPMRVVRDSDGRTLGLEPGAL